MATITEDYCSFEISKLLKEKGFDGETDMYYSPEGKLCCWMPNGLKSRLDNKGCETWWWKCVAPTLQRAIKWLREEKNILIYFYPVIDLQVKNKYTFYWGWDGKKKRHDASHIGDKHNYESFEQAVEAAIKHCLKHLI